jgi:hypothetical protein
MMGLIDVKQLQKHPYDENKSGINTEKSGPGRGQVGGVSGSAETRNANGDKAYRDSGSESLKSTLPVKKTNTNRTDITCQTA